MFYLLKQVELATRARLEEILRPAGLTALQYTALTVLASRPNLTSAELARNSFVRTQSMADLVGGLIARGLVDRHRDPGDRRRLVLAVTDNGKELLQRFEEEVAGLEKRMLADFSKSEGAQFRAALVACRTALAVDHPQLETEPPRRRRR